MALFTFYAVQANHYTFVGGNTGEVQWQVWIYGATLPDDVTSFEADDELAIYDGSTLVGHLKLTVTPSESNWTSSCLIAYSKLSDGSDGYTSGNVPTIKIWDASAGTEYLVDNVTFHPSWYQSHSSNTFPSSWGYSYVSLQTTTIATGTLSGTVKTVGGGDLEGVTVSAGSYSDVTDVNGDYSISNLPTGTYTVTATKSGYDTETASKTITDGGTTDWTFTMDAWSANYSFGGGNPADSIWTLYIEDATIDGTDMAAQDEIAVYDGTTLVGTFVLTQVCTSSNKFENDLIAFASLADGTNGWDAGNAYSFKAWDNSAGSEYTNVTATLSTSGEYHSSSNFPGSEDTYSYVSFAFTTNPGSFTGTINVNGATVTATNLSTSATYSTTSSGGSYTISNVPVGSYSLAAQALGYSDISGSPYTVTSGSATTVNITMASLSNVTQNISLTTGYQFVSRNVQPADEDMDDIVRVEDDITSNLDFIRNTDGDTYDYVAAAWVNNIGDWEKEEGYLFKMDGADLLSITGYQIDQSLTPIDLSVGTQFISYLPTFTMDIQTAFTDILDNLDWAKNSDGQKLRKIGGTWVNNIGSIGPGEGIQVKMTGTDQLTYTSTVPAPRGITEEPQLKHFLFTGGNAAANMFRVFIDTEDFEYGDEIAAFDGSTLIGAMVFEDDADIRYNDLNVFSVTNNGPGYTAGNPIILKGWDASENKVYSITFELSNPYGDAYMMDTYPNGDNKYSVANTFKNTYGIDENLASSIKVYPNPAKNNVNIYAPVVTERIEIIDLLGKVVYSTEMDTDFMEVSTSGFKPGIYLIRINTSEGIVSKKLMIQ